MSNICCSHHSCLAQLALVQWKSNFFLHVQSKHQKLAGAILRLIELQRNGDTIDQGLVKKVVDSFVSLGLDETDTNKACLDVYKVPYSVSVFLNFYLISFRNILKTLS
jgi:hypothetical protein